MSFEVQIVVVQIAVLVFAVSCHESAHGWMAWKCGDPTAKDLGRISLNPLRHIDPLGSVILPALLAFSGAPVFGWAKPVPVVLARTRDPRTANLLISAAGPLSNLALAAAAAALVLFLRPTGAPGEADPGIFFQLAFFTVVVNLVLAIFNFLPLPPLDGFGVLRSLAPDSLQPALSWVSRYGMVVLLLLLLSGSLSAILGPPLNAVQRWMLGV